MRPDTPLCESLRPTRRRRQLLGRSPPFSQPAPHSAHRLGLGPARRVSGWRPGVDRAAGPGVDAARAAARRARRRGGQSPSAHTPPQPAALRRTLSTSPCPRRPFSGSRSAGPGGPQDPARGRDRTSADRAGLRAAGRQGARSAPATRARLRATCVGPFSSSVAFPTPSHALPRSSFSRHWPFPFFSFSPPWPISLGLLFSCLGNFLECPHCASTYHSFTFPLHLSTILYILFLPPTLLPFPALVFYSYSSLYLISSSPSSFPIPVHLLFFFPHCSPLSVPPVRRSVCFPPSLSPSLCY